MKRALRAGLAGLLRLLTTPLFASALKPDEEVLFVPTVARAPADGRVSVPVEAWVHEHEPRRGARCRCSHAG